MKRSKNNFSRMKNELQIEFALLFFEVAPWILIYATMAYR